MSLSDYHGRGAFRVVIHYGIDSGAHGIAAHQPGIIGLEQFGHRADIIHAGVEPEVVAIWIEDDWHPVVNGSW